VCLLFLLSGNPRSAKPRSRVQHPQGAYPVVASSAKAGLHACFFVSQGTINPKIVN
jgi:hypothetical protein